MGSIYGRCSALGVRLGLGSRFGLACRRASAAGDGPGPLINVLLGHAAAPLAWRGHQRRQGDWRPQLGSELWTSAPPPRLSLEALQAHYAASYQPRRPRKISTAAALSGEACPWYSPRGLRIWAKEAACSARGVHVCEDRHGTRCVCHTRPRSQKNRSRFFKIEPS